MKLLRQTIRWVLVAASTTAAIVYPYLFLAQGSSIDVVVPVLNELDRTPVGLSPFFAAYLSIGLLYFFLFELIDGEEYEFDSVWERVLTFLIVIYWPLGLIGEIIGANMIVTSESALKRFFNFFFEAIFIRLVVICSFGTTALWQLNSHWPA